eukprot:SAG11_NODE_9630_length_894_cov_1.740881_1_plen_262_part_01
MVADPAAQADGLRSVHGMDPADFSASPKYKEFSRIVVDVLDSFIKCRDWPDFIHSIETLKNVFQKHLEFPAVPHKTTIAKRLAQGCTSATDAVHIKSLELYEIIFIRVGKEQLAADLALYTLGIFPLFGHAAPPAQLKILEIVEKHLLPLGPRLIPCLSGLLPALLPGLDDTKEQRVYCAVLELLEVLETRISTSHFYHALWHSMLLNPRVRLGGLHLLDKAKRFSEYVIAGWSVLSRDSPCLPDANRLVIKSLCSCLDDER